MAYNPIYRTIATGAWIPDFVYDTVDGVFYYTANGQIF